MVSLSKTDAVFPKARKHPYSHSVYFGQGRTVKPFCK